MSGLRLIARATAITIRGIKTRKTTDEGLFLNDEEILDLKKHCRNGHELIDEKDWYNLQCEICAHVRKKTDEPWSWSYTDQGKVILSVVVLAILIPIVMSAVWDIKLIRYAAIVIFAFTIIGIFIPDHQFTIENANLSIAQ